MFSSLLLLSMHGSVARVPPLVVWRLRDAARLAGQVSSVLPVAATSPRRFSAKLGTLIGAAERRVCRRGELGKCDALVLTACAELA